MKTKLNQMKSTLTIFIVCLSTVCLSVCLFVCLFLPCFIIIVIFVLTKITVRLGVLS